MNRRLVGVDVVRGVAIVLMVLFHFCYDLNHFGFIDIEILRDGFWLNFRGLIVTLFLFVVGVSLALAHKDGINWQKVKKRSVMLFFAALMVTIATYITFPRAWVYFGVLHVIWLFSLLGLLFINRGYLALFVGVSILIAYNFFDLSMHPLFMLLQEPLSLPQFTVDLVPLIPWFAVVLLGVAVVGLGLEVLLFQNRVFEADTTIKKMLAFMGKHALLIYLIHQPILFGATWLVKSLL